MKLKEFQFQKSRFSLYVVSVCSDLKQAPIIEEIRNQSQIFTNSIPEEIVKDLFKVIKNVKVIKGSTCGIGKSKYAEVYIKEANLDY